MLVHGDSTSGGGFQNLGSFSNDSIFDHLRSSLWYFPWWTINEKVVKCSPYACQFSFSTSVGGVWKFLRSQISSQESIKKLIQYRNLLYWAPHVTELSIVLDAKKLSVVMLTSVLM